MKIDTGIQSAVLAALLYCGAYALLTDGAPLAEAIIFFLLLTLQGILHMASMLLHKEVYHHDSRPRRRYRQLVALVLGMLLGGWLLYQALSPITNYLIEQMLLLICLSAVFASVPLGLYYHIICWRELLGAPQPEDQAPR